MEVAQVLDSAGQGVKASSAEMSARGKAAAAKMTAEQLSARGKAAAEKRWAKKLAKVTHGSPDRTLRLGDVELQCYVLDNGKRVITQTSLQAGIGIRTAAGGEKRLVEIGSGLEQKGVPIKDLLAKIRDPLKFVMPNGGPPAHGYEASTLVDLCNAILTARRMGVLHPQQEHLARQCEIVVTSLAKAGIDALVDEVTGYQMDRANGELQKLLAKYVGEELSSWVRTFKPGFYKQIYRLRGWKLNPKSHRKPGVVAKYTCDLVYDRVCPTLLEELKKTRANCEDGGGKKGGKLHQYMTSDFGHPRLMAHIEGVTAVARFSKSWDEFQSRMDEVYPRRGATLPIPFPEDDDLPAEVKEGDNPHS